MLLKKASHLIGFFFGLVLILLLLPPQPAHASVVSSGGITEAEAQSGGQQRKVVYANGNWYAVYTDASTVFYKKSSDGVTWGSAVTLDSTNIPFAPSMWVEGNIIYVAWLRDTGDAIAVNTINTASSDALGTQCTTGDLGTFSVATPSDYPALTVTDDGTVYVVEGGNTAVVEKLVYSGCTFTNITTGSSMTTGDTPAVTSIGNTVHLVGHNTDVASNQNIYHSVYNGSAWESTQGNYSGGTARKGGQQRKVLYVNSSWYAFYTDSTTTGIFYKKSSDGMTWGSAVTIDATNSPNAPTIWAEGNTIYVAWFRDVGDTLAVNTINTASSDAVGTQCNSASPGTLVGASGDYVTMAIADDGTVYIATGGSTTAVVDKLTYATCTFTDITTGSGLTLNDTPTLTTIGNNLHMVFQPGVIAHSIYNGTSWTATGGGITELEAQRGGQQRKIVFVNGNWYSFYTDESTVFYKKSSDGITWGSPVTVDSTNISFAPTVWVEGTTIPDFYHLVSQGF